MTAPHRFVALWTPRLMNDLGILQDFVDIAPGVTVGDRIDMLADGDGIHAHSPDGELALTIPWSEVGELGLETIAPSGPELARGAISELMAAVVDRLGGAGLPVEDLSDATELVIPIAAVDDAIHLRLEEPADVLVALAAVRPR